MNKVISILLFVLGQYLSFGQGYSTMADTFYVQTPEYAMTLGVDSLHFPCSITTPDIGSDFPVLILVHGTSALDRNSSSTKDFLDSLGADYRKVETFMFYEIADSLSRNGIVVLRYDKRSFTVNCIEKPACWFADTISPYDYIKDIHHAVDFAKKIPNVDTCNIFLAGHSQGGSFVSQVGYERQDIRGVLNMAGTALPIDSVAIYQTEVIDSDPIGANILRQQFDSLRNGLWPMTSTLYNQHFSPRFWLDWISHADSAMIVQQNSDKPTALMNGTADRFVPSSIHHQAWLDSITRSNVTFQLFADIDHGFGAEFDSLMSPQVLEFMANWIHTTSADCLSTDIKEPNSTSDFLIFPNPTNGNIQIQSNSTRNTPFQLIDIHGRRIKQGVLEGQTTNHLDLETMEDGLYFLWINGSVTKLIKK